MVSLGRCITAGTGGGGELEAIECPPHAHASCAKIVEIGSDWWVEDGIELCEIPSFCICRVASPGTSPSPPSMPLYGALLPPTYIKVSRQKEHGLGKVAGDSSTLRMPQLYTVSRPVECPVQSRSVLALD